MTYRPTVYKTGILHLGLQCAKPGEELKTSNWFQPTWKTKCITLTDFMLKYFIIMSWKSGFPRKLCYVAMKSDNITFYACEIIKVTSGFNLKKIFFFTRWRHHPKISWNIFQMQITPLLRRHQDPQGCLQKGNCQLSLNLVAWCAVKKP